MAHDKVYAMCENYCKEETMTKEQINDRFDSVDDDLDSKVDKLDIKVLSGIKTVAATDDVTIEEEYPPGFTYQNCIVIGQMATPLGSTGEYASGQVMSTTGGGSANMNFNPKVTFTNENIRIVLRNYSSSSKSIHYKIALMKLS